MKTVGIKFILNKSSKKYYFLTDVDLGIGDRITDPNYNGDIMEVVDTIEQDYPVFQGHTLKILNVRNWIKATNKNARAVLVTLEQAREWYESGNEALKQVALSVYSEQELKLNYSEIQENIPKSTIYVPSERIDEFKLCSRLAFLAEYFNKGWNKTINNEGYFLTETEYTTGTETNLGDVYIAKHSRCKQVGIIYFKRKEDLVKAYNIIKNINY